jgi:hypothetical protein
VNANATLVASVVERVVTPLVVGGPLRPVKPIGEARALDASVERDAVATAELDVARADSARRLAPVNGLAPLGRSEWLLACALNDLLQVHNASLDDGAAARLLSLADRTLSHAGPPSTALDALVRFATFRRLPELVRDDTDVISAASTRTFRGGVPPRRLVVMPELRGVRVATRRVPLGRFADDHDGKGPWLQVLGRLLAATPLVDLLSAARAAPRFVWSGAAVAMIAVAPARSLMLRAARGASDVGATLEALRSAAENVPGPVKSELILPFIDDVATLSA